VSRTSCVLSLYVTPKSLSAQIEHNVKTSVMSERRWLVVDFLNCCFWFFPRQVVRYFCIGKRGAGAGFLRLLLLPRTIPTVPSFSHSLTVLWLRHYATSLKAAGSRRDKMTAFFFSNYLILPALLRSGVHSASNRNEYQKQKINVSGEQKAAGE
jgi:hypothetical protein